MKKKLMAMLVAAAMLVCMMPAMAFADEAPAEEQVVQATEEVVVPEAAEEDAVAPETEGAVLEDEAVVEEAVVEEAEVLSVIVSGKWNAWVFNFTGNEDGLAYLSLYVNDELQDDYKLCVGENDFTELANLYADEGHVTITLKIIVTGEYMGKYEQTATSFKAKVAVDQASSQDTIFTYKVDKVVTGQYYYKEPGMPYEEGTVFRIKDVDDDFVGINGTDLFGNTLTLKAGETSAEGYLYYGYKNAKKPTPPTDTDTEVCYAYLIQEEGNTGNYPVDASVWAALNFSVLNELEPKGYARFDSMSDLQAFLDKLNASTIEKATEMLMGEFKYDEMTFTHAVEAKGVQTGDSNSLGLWVVVMAVAGVAAAAVALKRREN